MSNSGKWQKYKYAVAALIAVVVFYGFVSSVYLFESQRSDPSYQAQFRAEFGDVTVSVQPQNVSAPPVPMYEAMDIALESGGWNSTSLENMTVNVSFNCLQIWNDSETPGSVSCVPFSFPVSNYTAVMFSNATYTVITYYVWDVTVTRTGGIPGSPIPMYWVDVATGKIVPLPPDCAPG